MPCRVVYSDQPGIPAERTVPAGVTLQELAPPETGNLVVCRLNAGPGFVSRQDWGYPLAPGDCAEFLSYPQSKDVLRPLLQIGLAVLAVSSGLGPLASLALSIGGGLLINALLPPTVATRPDVQAVSPTYSTSLTGNQARSEQPIPKLCGRQRVLPPFAAQPYFEYDANGDQYYYAVFAVGYGNHVLERALIADTPINHFADVLTAAYLPPGTQPTRVKANVVTAPEVGGIDMLTGAIIGAFSASGPGLPVSGVGIDMLAPRGLAHQNDDGSMGSLTMTWRVEYRVIDDFGVATTNFTLLAAETRTANKTKVQRWTNVYSLPASLRVEVRVVRTDRKSTSSRDLHDLQWGGLRGYLTQVAPLNAGTAHFEVVMRASEQLSQLSQRSIALILQALCRTWSPGAGWSAEIYTRNAAWWLLELATNAVWGLGLPDSRIDLQSFYDLAVLWDSRQDRFDFCFDTSMDAWEAMQMIARTGRARVFRRQGVLTIARDSLAVLPVTAFTPRNTQPGSMSLSETLPTRELNDGYIVEYFSNRTWTWLSVNCPCPGVGTITKPIRLRLPGITGSKQAEREGLYEAARMLYRRISTRCTVEMEGLLPAYMDLIRWMPEVYGYGQSGDVVAWVASTLTVTLSEPPNFGASNLLTLVRDDGSLTPPVSVLPGSSPYEVVLPLAPDFDLIVNSPSRERPKFLFGPSVTSDELVKISAIGDGGKTPEGAQLYDISAVIDDIRIHQADNMLLPSPGAIQDPVDVSPEVPGGASGGGTLLIPQLYTYVGLGQSSSDTSLEIFRLNANGTVYINHSGVEPSAPPWLLNAPVEASQAAQFEIRETLLASATDSGSIPLNTWVALGVPVSFELPTGVTAYSSFLLEIRDVATHTVQTSATITLTLE